MLYGILFGYCKFDELMFFEELFLVIVVLVGEIDDKFVVDCEFVIVIWIVGVVLLFFCVIMLYWRVNLSRKVIMIW